MTAEHLRLEATQKQVVPWKKWGPYTENETNTQRIFGVPNRTPFVKDSMNNYVVHGRKDAVNPEEKGTKAAVHHRLTVKPNERQVRRLRLCDVSAGKRGPFSDFDQILETRYREADEFYATIIPSSLSADEANVMQKAVELGKMAAVTDAHKPRWRQNAGARP
jgi:hypothetical protein